MFTSHPLAKVGHFKHRFQCVNVFVLIFQILLLLYHIISQPDMETVNADTQRYQVKPYAKI